ncbi:hypothetical protein [Mycobacterium kyorinense]|uniref:Secreted protein n=1 Tax=Mycobacterium kyorinense TaxID=487514 RepID=A0A1X1Y402_9MYCO|nr:hypothetical protein [Mycobacterium kyorinense]ORW05815.1 hypothetical protein AWC14_01890 [Mycobacterium kyorinense]
MRKSKLAQVLAVAAVAVAPFVVVASPPATAGPNCGHPGLMTPEMQRIYNQICGNAAGVNQPRPGGNAHCNSFLDGSGNDNTAAYLACCNDAVMAGQTPC